MAVLASASGDAQRELNTIAVVDGSTCWLDRLFDDPLFEPDGRELDRLGSLKIEESKSDQTPDDEKCCTDEEQPKITLLPDLLLGAHSVPRRDDRSSLVNPPPAFGMVVDMCGSCL